MKKQVFLMVAFIATVFLTACNNEIAVESMEKGQEISFRLQGGMPDVSSRALATTIANLEAFVVYGTDDVLAATNDLIFDGATVAREFDSSPASFTYAPKKYFSEGAIHAGFLAFSPVSASISNPDLTALLTGASFDYTVPEPDDSQEDLLVAMQTVIPAPGMPPVSLEFSHALARIFVTATNDMDDPVIIESLTLSNLYSEGKMEIDYDFYATPQLSSKWTNHANMIDYEYILAETGVAVPAQTTTQRLVTSMEQGMMVLPQETQNTNDDDVQDAGDFALVVEYSIGNLTSQTAYILLEDKFEFEANKQYTINISFSGATLILIDFTVTVKDFEAPIEVDYPI